MQRLFIFIGQSGAGKGTQAALLVEKLAAQSGNAAPFYIETGSKFRSLIATALPTARRTRALIEKGRLPPAFLGVHAWSHELVTSYDGASDVVLDGTPRVTDEVAILLSAIDFYGWQTHVICINVSDEWAYERTIARGREDDKRDHDVLGRINWFHESVEPAIALLRADERMHFHDIHGEQSIERVHTDICTSLGISYDTHKNT